MGVMTISMKKKDEENIRNLARKIYGNKKGAISRVISEAVKQRINEIEQEELRKRALYLLNNSKNLGKKYWKNREDLYDRA